MTTKHNISRASEIYAGALHKGVFNTNQRAGAPIGNLVQVSLGTPTLGATTTLRAAAAVAAAGAISLDATALDVGRNVTITSAGNDSGITFTVNGKDAHGVPVTEVVTGANAGTAATAKTFKTIDSIVASGAAAGNVSVGDGDVLGIPYALAKLADVLAVYAGDTEELAASTVVVADAAAATGTTGDVRGTVDPNTALDGSTEIVVWMKVDGSSPEALGGVEQYAA